MAYHRQQGVDTAIVRIFNTYGPRMRPHDGRAIPTFLRQALQDRPITVFGDGSQTRSFCYVDDLIRGMIALAESGEHQPGQRRQPGRVHAARAGRDGHRGDRLALGDRLRGAADRRPAGAPARHRRSPQKLLGWEPEVSLREGLRARSTTPASRRSSERRAAVSSSRDIERDAVVGRPEANMPTTTPRRTQRAPSTRERAEPEDRRLRAAPPQRRPPQAAAGAGVPAAHGHAAAPRARALAAGARLRRHLARRSSPRWRQGGAPRALGPARRRSTRRRTSSPSPTCVTVAAVRALGPLRRPRRSAPA